MSTITTWSDDDRQLTVRTDMGPGAAVRLAAFEAEQRKFTIKTIHKVAGHEHTRWRDYVYEVKR